MHTSADFCPEEPKQESPPDVQRPGAGPEKEQPGQRPQQANETVLKGGDIPVLAYVYTERIVYGIRLLGIWICCLHTITFSRSPVAGRVLVAKGMLFAGH